MYLYKLSVKNFKRLKNIEVIFGKTTFIIGENNHGKSSVLQAIDTLLSNEKNLKEAYFNCDDGNVCDSIVLEAEFRNLPVESWEWRGFKGRVFKYDPNDPNDPNDTGLYCRYRKTYDIKTGVKIEMFSQERKAKFETIKEFIDNGIEQEVFENAGIKISNLAKKISDKEFEKLDDINEIWEIVENSSESWFMNPGGISQNVISKLPKYILIPAHSSSETLSESKGALHDTLSELFNDVRESSINFQEAQKYLNLLSQEFNPDDASSQFGQMMNELNMILSKVFPETKLHVGANLSEANDVIKPKFDVEMASNVRTKVEHQGTGMVRSAVFGMLRYREQQLLKSANNRPLIIGFEEPELYLHPNASNQMRESIYDLSSDNLQIIATTHSPYFIDLSKSDEYQVINSFRKDVNEIKNSTFNVTESFKAIESDPKLYLKMLLSIDDRVARVFFVKQVIIVEGNTEEIVLKETLKLIKNKEVYNKIVSDFEIVNARGKATIIGLVKYLTAMGIEPIVIHDADTGVEGAEKFNKPIEEALGGKGKIFQMINEMEDVLGYPAPSNEKPYKAYQETQKWKEWDKVPQKWKDHFLEIFEGYAENSSFENSSD